MSRRPVTFCLHIPLLPKVSQFLHRSHGASHPREQHADTDIVDTPESVTKVGVPFALRHWRHGCARICPATVVDGCLLTVIVVDRSKERQCNSAGWWYRNKVNCLGAAPTCCGWSVTATGNIRIYALRHPRRRISFLRSFSSSSSEYTQRWRGPTFSFSSRGHARRLAFSRLNMHFTPSNDTASSQCTSFLALAQPT